MSGRVTSSGYMPPVCSNRVRRRVVSSTSNRSAMPGRYQTGSSAALVTATSRVSWTTVPSTVRRPASMASLISGRVRRALVMAMVGRMSTPSATSAAKSCWIRWPQGSSETILCGSAH